MAEFGCVVEFAAMAAGVMAGEGEWNAERGGAPRKLVGLFIDAKRTRLVHPISLVP
jgi:hypothetical protein